MDSSVDFWSALLTETIDHPIPLDQSQVNLVAAVLQQAVWDCRPPAEQAAHDGRDDGITLGRLAAHWTGIAEREEHCDVINVNGERLYVVPLSLEGWYQVRAALSEHATRLSLKPSDNPESRENRRRARQALLLVDRIKEAIHER
ncbi:hypothetical protein [Peterkaempfera bronchialis]|uniref:Uncharacterized protein n=1 Tax=Peterkaempfera bronchialis TaxID=2126346 RepID=A0A345SYH6_9ACTN|nr:hypothetical protein [Peterkaempfera bronchialis]AXI78781.1 hypothetical protein C7M71_016500 [Peterkaempfera bronchialis]